MNEWWNTIFYRYKRLCQLNEWRETNINKIFIEDQTEDYII